MEWIVEGVALVSTAGFVGAATMTAPASAAASAVYAVVEPDRERAGSRGPDVHVHGVLIAIGAWL